MRRLQPLMQKNARAWHCLAGLVTIAWLVAPAWAATEAEVRAAMIFNIARFVEWPASESQTTHFAICTVGAGDVTDALGALAGKQLHGKPVRIVTVRRDTDLAHCQVVYLTAEQSLRLPAVGELLAKFDAAALTVGDSPNFLALGGTVQLSTVDGKPRFGIDRRRAEQHHLAVNAKLLQLALPEWQ